MNGIWLCLLLGRWSMITGWRDLLISSPSRSKREFVSVDARLDDLKKDTRSYEMLSRDDSGKVIEQSVTPSVVTPISPTLARSGMGSPTMHSHNQDPESGRRTPDFFGQTQRYHTPARSFSSPRPPQQPQQATVTWDPTETYARGQSPGVYSQDGNPNNYVNPLGMNRL